jgi:hypothetical protein
LVTKVFQWPAGGTVYGQAMCISPAAGASAAGASAAGAAAGAAQAETSITNTINNANHFVLFMQSLLDSEQQKDNKD